jgi:Cof subfamily protein (haloacid dehalogenase superfamily)
VRDAGVHRPRVRLLALDVDGTLLTSKRVVSPRTRAALDAARRAGVRLLLVTGRRLPSARRVATDLGGDIPLVLHHGALIVEGGELLRCRPLPLNAARRAIGLGVTFGVEPIVHCGARGEGRLMVRAQAHPSNLVRSYLERARGEVEEVPDILAALGGEPPIQVMFGGPLEHVDPLRMALHEHLREEARVERSVYPASDLTLLEVLERSVGKAEAVALLQERWGIGAEETLAIGDNWTDREMIERAGIGFVMGNADPELRRQGLPVLPSNDEDGVAVAVEDHVLREGKRG